MTVLEGPHGNTFYEQHTRGPGAPVMLLHSGGASGRQWRKLVEVLAPAHRLLVPDLLGMGRSPAWPEPTSFDLSQDVQQLQALLDTQSEPVHLVGHSYGGFLALQLALKNPDAVRSLALYEPVAFAVVPVEDNDAVAVADAHYTLGQGGDSRWLQIFIDYWGGEGAWARLPEMGRAEMRRVGWKLSREVSSLLADRTPLSAYATLRKPCLLMSGSTSPRGERLVVEQLAKAIQGASLQSFEGLGHMAPLTHAELVNLAITRHLATS